MSQQDRTLGINELLGTFLGQGHAARGWFAEFSGIFWWCFGSFLRSLEFFVRILLYPVLTTQLEHLRRCFWGFLVARIGWIGGLVGAVVVVLDMF